MWVNYLFNKQTNMDAERRGIKGSKSPTGQ